MEQKVLKKKRKKKRRHRKVGRPKGHYRKKFEETRIGFFLQHEVPIEYQLLKDVTLRMNKRDPPAALIEAISYSSNDQFFRKTKFWRSLIEYKNYGCCPPIPIKTNVRKELYYIRRRLKEYVV